MQNELFGEEDLLLENKHYSFTVMCNSADGELCIISNIDFQNIVL